jgi:hypothetical protein
LNFFLSLHDKKTLEERRNPWRKIFDIHDFAVGRGAVSPSDTVQEARRLYNSTNRRLLMDTTRNPYKKNHIPNNDASYSLFMFTSHHRKMHANNNLTLKNENGTISQNIQNAPNFNNSTNNYYNSPSNTQGSNHNQNLQTQYYHQLYQSQFQPQQFAPTSYTNMQNPNFVNPYYNNNFPYYPSALKYNTNAFINY